MIGETARNEQIEKERFEQSQKIYGFNPSREERLIREEQVLKKRLKQISIEKGEDFRRTEELQKELSRRRNQFKKFQFEKKLSASVIQQTACQETHTDKSGELIFGI